jgi:hypothetical protein
MRVRLKLAPGQAGTKKLVQEFGDQLLCVRYRYDAEKKRRYKTVELVVEEVPWEPRSNARTESQTKTQTEMEDSLVEVSFGDTPVEEPLHRRLWDSGARWFRDRRTYVLSRSTAVRLGLGDRIVKAPVSAP